MGCADTAWSLVGRKHDHDTFLRRCKLGSMRGMHFWLETLREKADLSHKYGTMLDSVFKVSE